MTVKYRWLEQRFCEELFWEYVVIETNEFKAAIYYHSRPKVYATSFYKDRVYINHFPSLSDAKQHIEDEVSEVERTKRKSIPFSSM